MSTGSKSTRIEISIKQSGGKLLVVEGNDENLFFDAALRDHLGLSDIQVMPIGGKQLLSAASRTPDQRPTFCAVVSLAVVRDADSPPVTSGVSVSAISEPSKSFNLRLWVPGTCRSSLSGRPMASLPKGPPRVGVFIVAEWNR